MTTHIAYTLTDNGLSLLINGENLTLNKDHVNYEKVKAALRAKRYDEIPGLVDLQKVAREWLGKNPDFRIEGGIVHYKDTAFNEGVSSKVIRMIDEDLDPEPLFKFLVKTLENPSYAAQQELLLFCLANSFLIHEDGDIIAYKSTGEDYMSIAADRNTGQRVRYQIGDIPTMPRHAVDDNRAIACSVGLHAAAYAYASTWAGTAIKHVMLVKIHPRDFVSIPHDYHNQKARVCRLEVIQERKDFTALAHKEVYTSTDVNAPHYEEWKRAVLDNDTTLGYAEWLEALQNVEDDEDDIDPFQDDDEDDDDTCSDCGHHLDSGVMYCSNCGHRTNN